MTSPQTRKKSRRLQNKGRIYYNVLENEGILSQKSSLHISDSDSGFGNVINNCSIAICNLGSERIPASQLSPITRSLLPRIWDEDIDVNS